MHCKLQSLHCHHQRTSQTAFVCKTPVWLDTDMQNYHWISLGNGWFWAQIKWSQVIAFVCSSFKVTIDVSHIGVIYNMNLPTYCDCCPSSQLLGGNMYDHCESTNLVSMPLEWSKSVILISCSLSDCSQICQNGDLEWGNVYVWLWSWLQWG